MKQRLTTTFIVFTALGALSIFLIIHEVIYQGNQDRLFFPSLQRSSAFHRITGVPYSGEDVQYFYYREDLNGDVLYFLVAQVSEATLYQVIKNRGLTEKPFTTDTLLWWRFPRLKAPKNLVYYTVPFQESVHLWYDKERSILYLREERD